MREEDDPGTTNSVARAASEDSRFQDLVKPPD